jgi:hypothetical protein
VTLASVTISEKEWPPFIETTCSPLSTFSLYCCDSAEKKAARKMKVKIAFEQKPGIVKLV